MRAHATSDHHVNEEPEYLGAALEHIEQQDRVTAVSGPRRELPASIPRHVLHADSPTRTQQLTQA
jgi:hypothetical protein